MTILIRKFINLIHSHPYDGLFISDKWSDDGPIGRMDNYFFNMGILEEDYEKHV